MNITLWVLQILMALHTLIGAIWKFSHSAEQTMPSLKSIPQSIWLGMSVLEVACAFGLLLPALNKSLGLSAPIAACVILAEMLAFCVLHRLSGATDLGPLAYWVVVAAVCALIAYGRFVLRPF